MYDWANSGLKRDALWKDESPSVGYLAVRENTISRENRYRLLIQLHIFFPTSLFILLSERISLGLRKLVFISEHKSFLVRANPEQE